MQPDQQPATLHTVLERAFRYAKAPGSLVTPITSHPEKAAELAIQQFAAFLRDQAAHMWREGNTSGAAFIDRLSREVDPLGPVMGTPAAGCSETVKD